METGEWVVGKGGPETVDHELTVRCEATVIALYMVAGDDCCRKVQLVAKCPKLVRIT